MKICQVCNSHTVDDGRVFHRTCKALAQAGYEVHLLAVGPGLKEYVRDGVTIHPLPECNSRTVRYARIRDVARMAAALQPDLFHVHEPNLLGAVLTRAGLRPVIYDVHESYLDILNESDWVPRWSRPFVQFTWDHWERRLVQRCAGIVVVTEPIAKRYSNLHAKVRVVANYPDCLSTDDSPPMTRNARTCVYAGWLTRAHGLSQIFEAIAILKKRDVEVQLDLAGTSISEEYLRSLWDEVGRLGIGRQVRYHGVLPRSKALILQRQAGIGLVPYLPLNLSLTGLPNKLMECMALGVPVVCSDFPLYREVACSNGAGIPVDPLRPDELADAIEYLVRNPNVARQMGEAGKRAVHDRFNWNLERNKLLELYREILNSSKS